MVLTQYLNSQSVKRQTSVIHKLHQPVAVSTYVGWGKD